MLFIHEEVKPGHGAAHLVTEAWFVVDYGSYGEWEGKQNEFEKNPALKKQIDEVAQKDGENLSSSRTFLGAYRKDLSCGPPVEIGQMRSFRVRTFRIKQGQGKAFEEGAGCLREEPHQASFAFYEVTAGMGSPSFIVLRPLKPLTELDAMEASEKAFQEALGEEGRKVMQKGFAETVSAVENQLFAFNPKLSFVAPSTAASDPAFWTPKESEK